MTDPADDNAPIWRHYAWVITVACTLCVMVSLGFGRFALGMLLPSMGATLPLSYAEMGFVSTGNFVGYMLGVVAAGRLVEACGERRVMSVGLTICALSIIAMGWADSFYQALGIYGVTGFSGGAANVTALGLVSHWFTRRLRGRAAGFQVTGSSFAIMFAGLALPQINLSVGLEGWRDGWMLLGGISLAAAIVSSLILRNRPADLGLEPAGGDSNDTAASRAQGHPGRRIVAHLGAIYFFFGMTYAVYLTFTVTALVDERGLNEAAAGRFWAFLGLLSVASGPLFGFLSDRFGRRHGLAMAFACFAASYALAAANIGPAALWGSVVLFGIAAWSVPAILGAAVGDYAGPRNAVRVLATITVAFACGQTVGPAVAGLLAEQTGSFTPSYAGITIAAVLAVIISLRLPAPRG